MMNAAHADTQSASVKISNVGALPPDARLTVTFTPALGSGCAQDSQGYVSPSLVGIRTVTTMLISAYQTQKNIQLIYNGCNATTGQVNITGAVLAP